MMVPTIHLNGTSAGELLDQVSSARLAVHEAIKKVRLAAPHARDYYTQGNDAIGRAEEEHLNRVGLLLSVEAQLADIEEEIFEAAEARRQR